MIREAGFKPRFLTLEEPQTVTASVVFAQGAREVELELPLGGVGGGGLQREEARRQDHPSMAVRARGSSGQPATQGSGQGSHCFVTEIKPSLRVPATHTRSYPGAGSSEEVGEEAGWFPHSLGQEE